MLRELKKKAESVADAVNLLPFGKKVLPKTVELSGFLLCSFFFHRKKKKKKKAKEK